MGDEATIAHEKTPVKYYSSIFAPARVWAAVASPDDLEAGTWAAGRWYVARTGKLLWTAITSRM